MTETLSLSLPAPPSVNNLFATVGKRRVRTAKYKNWSSEAWLATKQQGHGATKPIERRVHVVMLHERRTRKVDLDNLCKAPLDFLVVMQFISDDSLIESITTRWSDTVKGMQIVVSPVAP